MSWYTEPDIDLRTLENLRRLHGEVKRHPYRLSNNVHYLNSYKKLLWEMGDIFFFVVRETKYRLAKNMVHDFNGAVGYLGNERYKYTAEVELHVENCISTIHELIDTEKVTKFYCFQGKLKDNILEAVGHHITYLWNDELQGYYLKVTPEQLPAVTTKIQANIDFWANSKDEGLVQYWTKFLADLTKYNKENS